MNSIIDYYDDDNDNDYYGRSMSSNVIDQQEGQHDDHRLSINYSLSWTGLLGATITVLITTLDDSVWLMPFVAGAGVGAGGRNNTCRAIIHAGIFLFTLMTLSLLCCVVALAVVRYNIVFNSSSSLSTTERLEIKFDWISVIICWILATGFYIKKIRKKRRRQRLKQQQQQQQQQQQDETTPILPLFENNNNDRSSEEIESESSVVNNNNHVNIDDSQEEPVGISSTIRPCTVASLTALGFLDEISYFPTLIIGNIFSGTELVLGTFFAGLIVLGIQVFLFHQCKPLIDFLDKRVPLYVIIACFAIILTFHLIWDIATLLSPP